MNAWLATALMPALVEVTKPICTERLLLVLARNFTIALASSVVPLAEKSNVYGKRMEVCSLPPARRSSEPLPGEPAGPTPPSAMRKAPHFSPMPLGKKLFNQLMGPTRLFVGGVTYWSGVSKLIVTPAFWPKAALAEMPSAAARVQTLRSLLPKRENGVGFIF